MNYPRLFSKLFCQPLALRDIERLSFESYLLGRIDGGLQRAALGDHEKRIKWIFEIVGNVAVINIDGVIDKQMSEIEAACYGGADLAIIDAALNEVAKSSTLTHVVLNVNSPGGSVVGVEETGARIAELGKDREIHAYIDVMACSAGYWLASQADIIYANPSAIVGSIGVYMAVLDASKWMEDEGLRTQMIKAGKWKDTGSSHRPLTEEETERLQASVDRIHNQFKAAVTRNRAIPDSLMEGQWSAASEAPQLVDKIGGLTLDEYVGALLR